MHDRSQLMLPQGILIALYLIVLVLANGLVTHYGQVALLLTSVLLVPFDFALRIRLQEVWSGRALWSRLFALMGVGGLLTVLILPDAERIAIASVSAFCVGSILGAVCYEFAKAHFMRWPARMMSLGCTAIADSILFPCLAFDDPSGWFMLAQALCKWTVSLVFLSNGLLSPKEAR